MNLKTHLFDYQETAVEKLLPLRVGGLFMRMGTGKTRTAIEMVVRRVNRGQLTRVVWFCPVSVKATTRHELHKHTDIAPADLCVFNERTNLNNMPSALIYVIGIESMSSSPRVILAANELINETTMVIVDESTYIKGHTALCTRRITGMSEVAMYRLIMTGMPISQGVVDLYSQMRFLHWKILGYPSFYRFKSNHLEYSTKYPGMIVRGLGIEQLAAKIEPYIFQITKEEAGLNLPPQLTDEMYYPMTREQQDWYDFAKNEILESAEGREWDTYIIFRLFTALQQISSGFWNRRLANGQRKLIEFRHQRPEVLEAAVQRIPDGEKITIWCKYHYSVTAVTNMLAASYGRPSVATYHGKLSEKQREAELTRFRTDEDVQFLCVTPGTGSHGLDFTVSAYSIFYENEFKYLARKQAEDRHHRYPQTRPVTYVDIVCENSIDGRIQRAHQQKGNVVAQFKAKLDQAKRDNVPLADLIREL